MHVISSFPWMRRLARVFAIVSMALVIMTPLAACGGSGSTTSSASGPVNLTFWNWSSGWDKAIALFNQTHPNIHVTMQNVGAGPAEYNKLYTAIKANNEPDLGFIEYQVLPTFESTGALVDLSQYGANSVKDQFVPWVWKQVTLGNAVLGIPGDMEPLALYYRKDIFDKYHLPVPTTWAQYADDAAKLHAANPNVYITDFPPKQPGQFVGLVWQNGGNLFTINGQSWKVSIKSSKHPKEATEFATWIFSNQQSLSILNAGGGMAATQAWLDNPVLNTPQPFWGKQAIGQVFKQAATEVNVNFQWGPTMDQVYNDMGDQFVNAVNGRGTLSDGLNAVQQSTVTFMQKQGFSAST